jgi:hypothetical protein
MLPTVFSLFNFPNNTSDMIMWLLIKNLHHNKQSKHTKHLLTHILVIHNGVVVIVLAIGPRVHRFKPGQKQHIYMGDKNP